MARSKIAKTAYVILQDQHGAMERRLPLHELLDLKSRPDYKRISATVYRRKPQVQPSDSRESPTMLTLGDMEFVASFRGLPKATPENANLVQRLTQRLERLAGYANARNFGSPLGQSL